MFCFILIYFIFTHFILFYYYTDLSACLKSLWQFKINFHEDLSDKTKQRIFEIIKNERTNFTVQTFVSIFYSFSHIGMKWSELNYNFDSKNDHVEDEKDLISYSTIPFQKSKNLQNIFLTGVSTYVPTMKAKQIINLIFIFRTMDIGWNELCRKTQNTLLSKLIIILNDVTPKTLVSILLFLSSLNILISSSDVDSPPLSLLFSPNFVKVMVDKNDIISKNKVYIDNDIDDKIDNENQNTDNIRITENDEMKNLLISIRNKIMIETRNIIEKDIETNDNDNEINEDNYIDKVESKIILDTFQKLNLFIKLDDTSKIFLLNRILSSSVDENSPEEVTENYIEIGDKNNINNIFIDTKYKNSVSADHKNVRSQIKKTLDENQDIRRIHAGNTNTVHTVRAFDLVKSMVANGVMWNDLSKLNQENFMNSLIVRFPIKNKSQNSNENNVQNVNYNNNNNYDNNNNDNNSNNNTNDNNNNNNEKNENRRNQNHNKDGSSGQFISFLRGLDILGIPWSTVSSETQKGILDYAISLYDISDNDSINNIDNNNNNNNNNNNKSYLLFS